VFSVPDPIRDFFLLKTYAFKLKKADFC